MDGMEEEKNLPTQQEDGFDFDAAKERVKEALRLSETWRDYAKQDYEFVQGKQWTDSDLNNMRRAKRPAITINRIRPIINLLCGYAAQNETEPDFLPRSEEDDRVSVHCRIGSLETTDYSIDSIDVVHCRIGSLEIIRSFHSPQSTVHCRIGSLEK